MVRQKGDPAKKPWLLQKSNYNIACLVFSYFSASKWFFNSVLCQIKTSIFPQILWQSCLHLSINLIISEMSFYQELNVTICYWTRKVLYIERKVVIFWKAILLETPTKAQRVWGKGTFFSSFGCLEGRKNGNGTKSVASHYQTNRMPTQ